MEELIYILRNRFGWQVRSGFTEHDLEGILQTGDEIAEAIEKWLPGVNGDSWIRKFLGNVVFHKGGLPQKVVSWANGNAKISLVFVNYHVWLDPTTFNSIRPTRWVAHELGHVLDNYYKWMAIWWGRGPSDELMGALNTKISGLRWINTKALAKAMPVDFSWTKHNKEHYPKYGDNSSADYFAETWAWSIHRPDVVPTAAKDWFMDWMRDQTLNLID